jgi:RNA polymerase sigma-70 factor (sigma-E family)
MRTTMGIAMVEQDGSGATVAGALDGAAPARRALDVARRDDWLEETFRRQYPPLVRLAAMLVDRDSAEEIVQDAFVRTHGRLHRIHPDKVDAYLRSAVVNGARSQLRRRQVRRRHQPDPPPDSPAAEDEGLAGTARHDLLRSLDLLPSRQREVLLLRYFADLSEAEIAATLGISTGSVKTHAHRGLSTLAAHMEARP